MFRSHYSPQLRICPGKPASHGPLRDTQLFCYFLARLSVEVFSGDHVAVWFFESSQGRKQGDNAAVGITVRLILGGVVRRIVIQR